MQVAAPDRPERPRGDAEPEVPETVTSIKSPRKDAKSAGKGRQRQLPTVPATFEVNEDARYSGVVSYYSKLKGYGFIRVAEKDVVPTDLLFVHWRAIQSEDRFPFLVKDLEVEFSLQKWREAGEATLRAKGVTLPGGAPVTMQDTVDAESKTFVGSQHVRYPGTLKFYDPRAGFGYVTIDPGHDLDGVPSELRVERAEVNAGGRQPQWMINLKVEFAIWKTSKGAFKAYNMTMPGGAPLTQEALENRVSIGGETYQGEVKVWNWQQGWGFIKIDPSATVPASVTEKLAQQNSLALEKAEAKGKKTPQEELLYFRRADVKPDCKLRRGAQVMFKIYTDDKGAGALDVHAV